MSAPGLRLAARNATPGRASVRNARFETQSRRISRNRKHTLRPLICLLAFPVEAGGSVLGAIGVSGAPNGEADDSCARAGIKAIADAIEF